MVFHDKSGSDAYLPLVRRVFAFSIWLMRVAQIWVTCPCVVCTVPFLNTLRHGVFSIRYTSFRTINLFLGIRKYFCGKVATHKTVSTNKLK